MQDEEYISSAKEVRKPSIGKSTAKMSVATTLSRVTGYLRVFALAYALGGDVVADTYNTANVMPNILFELIMGGILGSVLIPIFVEYLNRGDKKETDYMLSNSINVILVFGVILSLIGALSPEFFVKAITYFEPVKATPLMIFFFRIFAFQMMFYAITAVFVSILNSHRRFTMPMVAPIFNNITVTLIILGIYVPLSKSNPELALTILAIGTTIGVAVMAIVQVPAVLKTGFKYQPVFNLRHPSIKQITTLGLPMLGFAIAVQTSNFFIYGLAQKFDTGPTAYQYSLMFFQLPYAIFAVSVMTAIFPELSEQSTKKDMHGFKRTLSLGLRATSFIVIPASVMLFILSRPIISLMLEYGKFDAHAVDVTAPVLSFFALGLPSYSLYNMLTRVYYSLQDTKTPMKISVISVPLQIAMNFIFVGILGIRGLALGYALTLTFAVAVQLYFLRKKIGPLGTLSIIKSLGKQFAAVIPAGVAMYFIYRHIDGFGMPRLMNLVADVFIAAGVGGAIYVGLALLFGVEEVDFIKRILRRFNRIKVKAA